MHQPPQGGAAHPLRLLRSCPSPHPQPSSAGHRQGAHPCSLQQGVRCKPWCCCKPPSAGDSRDWVQRGLSSCRSSSSACCAVGANLPGHGRTQYGRTEGHLAHACPGLPLLVVMSRHEFLRGCELQCAGFWGAQAAAQVRSGGPGSDTGDLQGPSNTAQGAAAMWKHAETPRDKRC